MTSRQLTVSTVIPAWYDPFVDDGAAAEAAVWQLAELATSDTVVGVELADVTSTLDGPVWTWHIHVTEFFEP